jgi:diguanylate cyclase (GGDEF)-like protein
MPAIPEEYYDKLSTLIQQAPTMLNGWVFSDMTRESPSIQPQTFYPELYEELEMLNKGRERRRENPPFHVDPDAMPLLKALILRARLEEAIGVEEEKARVNNARALAVIEGRLTLWDKIIRDPVFRDLNARRLPHLMDVVNMERFEDVTRSKSKWEQRTFDEKFRIHLAPTLFHTDLTFYRHKCGARDVPLVTVFLDIDKFKAFNTEVGETHVDRHVLRPFMAALEASVYGHGQVYRFGGDEYAILFPSTDEELATVFLKRIQAKLGSINYSGLKLKTTVSIGFCTAYPDCYLTNEELLQRSERAKNFAKEGGRNCMATYCGRFYDDSELKILS